MPAVSRPAWMLALSGIADRRGGPRRSPVEIIATMGSYVTRSPAAGISGLRAGPFGRWADGVTAMREDCAAFARHWRAHNAQVLGQDPGTGPLWVVLGDSTAQGLGAPRPDAGYVGQVLAGLRQRTGLPWRVLNLSVSGALTRDVIGAQLPRLPAHADLVTCGIGVNDILYTSPARLFADLRALIAAVPDRTVLLDLPLPAGCWGFLGRASVPYVSRINRTIHAAAAARGLPVAEVSAHFLPPWTGKFAPDCFHPSQDGYRDWSRALLAAVGEARPRRKQLESPAAGRLHSRHDRHGSPASRRAALTRLPQRGRPSCVRGFFMSPRNQREDRWTATGRLSGTTRGWPARSSRAGRNAGNGRGPSSDPAYYRWTQWIFLRIFNSWYDPAADRARPVGELIAEFASGRRATPDGRPWRDLTAAERADAVDAHRLAYLSEQVVNWCPGLGTVLADEEVTGEGRSAVGNYPVHRRPLRQWMLRITAFAERLLAGLDEVDWPEHVKRLQRNWIGPSGGPYHLKDWLFSRQRYWGEPFPIVYDEADPGPGTRPVALPEDMLPVTLPEMTDFRPVPQDDASDPVPALARASGWAEVTLDLGDGPRRYRRELNVMPQWAGSCWYYLRYLDPFNETAPFGAGNERYWMSPSGVDLYVGGVEHAVLHLLYARFWHKVLYDYGVAGTQEPFGKLLNQGYILADAFTDARGLYVPAAEVTRTPDGWERAGQPVTRRSGKMGKSLKNGISPDDIYASHGADTLRLYEMAMGPLDGDRPWHTDDITGMHRFLQRRGA